MSELLLEFSFAQAKAIRPLFLSLFMEDKTKGKGLWPGAA